MSAKTDDLVPLSDYDDRVGKGRKHCETYKRLREAGEAGHITMLQHTTSRRLYVSKSEAEAYIAGDRFARCPAKKSSDDGRLAALEEKLDRLFREVLAAGPLTDEEIAAAAGLLDNTVRPRRGELVRDGLVVAVDELGKTRAGKRATRWGVKTT